MSKYRKKPVVVEAEQFSVIDQEQHKRLGIRTIYPNNDEHLMSKAYGCEVAFQIDTLEGPHICSHGDYIITGVKGERYPCKPDIFEMTYEPVDE